jgi:hypothetical protein
MIIMDIIRISLLCPNNGLLVLKDCKKAISIPNPQIIIIGVNIKSARP